MMAMTVYAETKSVTVTFGSHAYQTFKTTQEGETRGLNINRAEAAPNIASSLITAQDTQDAVLWKPARITTAAQTHTYTMTGTKLNEPLWVEIEGEFVKGTGGTGVAGVARPDFQVTVRQVELTGIANNIVGDQFTLNVKVTPAWNGNAAISVEAGTAYSFSTGSETYWDAHGNVQTTSPYNHEFGIKLPEPASVAITAGNGSFTVTQFTMEPFTIKVVYWRGFYSRRNTISVAKKQRDCHGA